MSLAAGVAPVAAQNRPQSGRLIVTVNDTTGGVLPTATVTLAGAEPATSAAKLSPLPTTNSGTAIFDNLRPGRYTVFAEFSGFEKSALREVRVRAGDNRETIVLELARLEDSVTVGRDQQVAGSDRASTFGSVLSRDQIEELSDDPAIMRQQLEDLAGPGMTIAVDSFEGGQLPNKSQIRSVRISRDQFAAESHFAGGIRIEIITQPGAGDIRGNARTNFYTSALDGTNALVDAVPPSQNRNGGINLSGGLLKDRMSFRLNFNGANNFTTPVQAASASGGTSARILGVTSRNTNMQVGGGIDWAVTKNQTVRFSVGKEGFNSRDSGANAYDAPERVYATDQNNWYIQAGHTGPIGRRMMLYNRLYVNATDSSTASAVEQLALIVPEDLNRGGAQRRGGTTTAEFSLTSDLDYVRGRHSFRTGLEIAGTHYASNAETNYLGTYYFEGPDAFAAGRPRSFTKRIGDPNISFTDTRVAMYVQDDIRLSKSLTMTPGVRYEVQSHVKDYNNVMPRYGVTWAPGQGKTTYRASLGIFHDWLNTNTYQQTLLFDGFRMQEVNVGNPAYPDPGPLGAATPVQRYLLADDIVLPRTARASLGLSRTINSKLSASAVYAYTWAVGQYVGENLNKPIDGVRPDPRFANVIRAVSDGEARAHSLETSVSLNLAGLGNNPNTGPFFQWRRALRLSGSYSWNHSDNNTDGPFATPATDLASDWGPANNDIRHRGSMSFGTAVIRGLSASLNLSRNSARPITIRTGFDDNGDLIYNDRPIGIGRNSARVPGQFNSSANFGYTFSLGRRRVNSGGGVSIQAGSGVPVVNITGNQAVARYRLSLSVSMQNLFNQPNYNGYSGVMTSRTFLQPTSVSGVRRTTVNLGLSF